MSATYLSADQNWADASTTYWFEMDGAEYGIVESGSDSSPVNNNGFPIDYNDHLAALVVAECIVTDEIRAKASGL